MVSLCILAELGYVKKFTCISVYITVEVDFMMNPIFSQHSLTTDVNLNFVCKIDKDWKSVIVCFMFFKNGII